MSNIIAPNGAVNSYLEDKEKRCGERIQAILQEEGCFISPSISITNNIFGSHLTDASWSIAAIERLPKNAKAKTNPK